MTFAISQHLIKLSYKDPPEVSDDGRWGGLPLHRPQQKGQDSQSRNKCGIKVRRPHLFSRSDPTPSNSVKPCCRNAKQQQTSELFHVHSFIKSCQERNTHILEPFTYKKGGDHDFTLKSPYIHIKKVIC